MIDRRHTRFFVAFCLLVAGCLLFYFFLKTETYQTLYLLPPNKFPTFVDDMDRTSLIECTQRHLSFLKKQNLNKVVPFGTESYNGHWLVHSLEFFLDKLKQNPSPKELQHFLKKNYLVYQAGGRKVSGRRQMLVTGYYEPLFEGSLTREPPFLTPVYSPPPSLVTLLGSDGRPAIGRYGHDNQFLPYWSRKEIEEDTTLLQGNELVFLKDPFEAFLLHIQGSGRISLPDKTVKTLRFAASNGLEYKSIGKVLADEKSLKLEDITIPTIRDYLQRHPEQQQRIFHHNHRYVFFTWGDDFGPKGSSGEILTPGRSIALDDTVLPGGTFGYLLSRIPEVGKNGEIAGWKPLTRFVFPQDSGAAITGGGRVDIFFGQGKDAEFSAHHIKEDGKLFFLIKKRQ